MKNSEVLTDWKPSARYYDDLEIRKKVLNLFISQARTGKGSTSCFITNILLANGYCVGTFNSPSVFGYNERFLLDGKAIDNGSVAKYVSIVAEERAKMIGEGLSAPTAF